MKKVLYGILFIAVVVVAFLGFRRSKKELPLPDYLSHIEFEKYENEALSFDFPKGWKLKEQANVEHSLYTFSLRSKVKGSSRYFLSFQRNESPEMAQKTAHAKSVELSDSRSIKNYMKTEVDEMGYDRWWVSNIEQKELTIGGEKGYLTTSCAEVAPEKIWFSMYFVSNGSYFVNIRIISHERDFEKDKMIAQKMLETVLIP